MKNLFFGILLLTLIGCASKYEVVQQLRVNMYHLVDIKTNEVEIILTSDTLELGQILKKKHIRIIAEVEE